MIAFQQKKGIDVEKFAAIKKEKLDNQLKDFMAKASEQKAEPVVEAQPAAEEATARQVVEEK